MMNTLQDVIYHRLNLQTCVCVYLCVASWAWIRPSRRTSACIQMGHRGFAGLWGQQCHGNGLGSCGRCEDLLSVRSAILVTLACHADSSSVVRLHTQSRTFGLVHTHARTHGLDDARNLVKTTTVRYGPVQCAWSSAEGLVNDHYDY